MPTSTWSRPSRCPQRADPPEAATSRPQPLKPLVGRHKAGSRLGGNALVATEQAEIRQRGAAAPDRHFGLGFEPRDIRAHTELGAGIRHQQARDIIGRQTFLPVDALARTAQAGRYRAIWKTGQLSSWALVDMSNMRPWRLPKLVNMEASSASPSSRAQAARSSPRTKTGAAPRLLFESAAMVLMMCGPSAVLVFDLVPGLPPVRDLGPDLVGQGVAQSLAKVPRDARLIAGVASADDNFATRLAVPDPQHGAERQPMRTGRSCRCLGPHSGPLPRRHPSRHHGQSAAEKEPIPRAYRQAVPREF